MASIDIASLSVVLVEPSPTQLKLIQRSLSEAGVSQIEALASGEEALAVMRQYPPDLVISAMYLPDMTATDLVQTMRELPALRDVPFMLISSETHLDALEPIRQAGVIAILPKPFSLEKLRKALRATVEWLDPRELELEHIDLEDLRVLVVDDSQTSRHYIQRVLSNMGVRRITLAKDGREGADTFVNSDFDLVVTDLNMPEMDGCQLVEYIRHELGNQEVPILMVTSVQDATRLANVEQAGVSAICDKPFDLVSIKDVLARVLLG